MKAKSKSIIYTVLADDVPVVVLEATSAEARELLRESWFVSELSEAKVGGQPLYKTGTRLRARPATEEEWITYDKEYERVNDEEEIMFVYLVVLDRK
jgi:hypothetical protein